MQEVCKGGAALALLLSPRRCSRAQLAVLVPRWCRAGQQRQQSRDRPRPGSHNGPAGAGGAGTTGGGSPGPAGLSRAPDAAGHAAPVSPSDQEPLPGGAAASEVIGVKGGRPCC